MGRRTEEEPHIQGADDASYCEDVSSSGYILDNGDVWEGVAEISSDLGTQQG